MNANNFKKVSGFGGVVTNSYGDPAIGVTVTVNVGGATLKATTDSNGFYMITYKTGKAQTYTVAVTGYNTQTGTIKANGFAVNNFKP